MRINERWVGFVAGCVAFCVGAATIVWWLNVSARPSAVARVDTNRSAGNDSTSANAREKVDIEGQFEQLAPAPEEGGGSWPGFRGPSADGVSREEVALASSWGAAGPPVLWSVALGEGYAGPAVCGGCVYVLDYDGAREADTLRCFALADGREVWRRWYKVRIKRNHGVSRTVPAVTERFVVTMGPKCHVLCVEARTGRFLWGMDLARDYGAEVPMWYTGQCPLVDGETAVLAPGGKALMMGVDCATGKILWETPNSRAWKMSHASITIMTMAGRRMYVYAAIGGIAGVAADGPERGRVLWESTEWNHAVVAPSPVALPDGRLFLTAGYGVGSRMLRVTESNGVYAAKTEYVLDRKVFACEQHTPLFFDGHLYAVLPSDAGALRQQLVCLRPDGTQAWNSGEGRRFGLGPFLIADGKIFVLSDDGTLALARMGGAGVEWLAAAKVLPGPEAWAPMALAGGRLLVRDRDRMVCLDVRAGREPQHDK